MSSYPGPLAAAEAFSVRGQSVLLTGAAGRIGRSIAAVFAANGARLTLSDRAGDGLREATERLSREHGGEAVAQAADLASPEDLAALVAAAAERFGGIDTVIHCGAIISSGPMLTESDDAFDRLYHTNVRSAWLLAKHAIPHLERTRGSMITIASVNGHRAMFPCSLYGGTKAAVINMSGTLAAEFGEKRVRFNTVSPGQISGDRGHLPEIAELLHPPHGEALLEAFGQEAAEHVPAGQPLAVRGSGYDVAMACLFLASPAARFVSGADLLVDGAKLRMFEEQSRHSAAGRGFWRRVREHLAALPEGAWRNARPEWVQRRR